MKDIGYLLISDGVKMKCSEQKAIEAVVEIFTHYYMLACKSRAEYDNGNKEALKDFEKYDLVNKSACAILLQMVGGRQMYAILMKTQEWASRILGDEDEEEGNQ